jgi:predicted DNA-binding WGR domain protein
MTRRFEFIAGSSYKFWEVHVHQKEVTVRFGRIGTAGQTQTKTFLDPATAAKHAEKLIREKTAKGYQEVSEPSRAA